MAANVVYTGYAGPFGTGRGFSRAFAARRKHCRYSTFGLFPRLVLLLQLRQIRIFLYQGLLRLIQFKGESLHLSLTLGKLFLESLGLLPQIEV